MLILLFLLNKIKFNYCIISGTKLKLIESLNAELNIKHFSVIKDSDFEVHNKVLNVAKLISFNKVFVSFLSLAQMNNSMHEYFTIPFGFHSMDQYHKRGYIIDEKRNRLVYPPKTMVMIFGKDLEATLIALFPVGN